LTIPHSSEKIADMVTLAVQEILKAQLRLLLFKTCRRRIILSEPMPGLIKRESEVGHAGIYARFADFRDYRNWKARERTRSDANNGLSLSLFLIRRLFASVSETRGS